jgi:hypothetical protein
MINKTGQNLSVLIIAEAGQDWQSFSTWYSVFKSLPEAKTVIACKRNGETPFQFFQWAKRLKVPVIKANNLYGDLNSANDLNCIVLALRRKLIDNNVLVFRNLSLCLEPFDDVLVNQINLGTNIFNENFWFVNAHTASKILDKLVLNDAELEDTKFNLGAEAKESENIGSLISYNKGCGRWLNTARGCPFSSAAGLIATSMTINENRIINLWKKMVPLYNAVS